MKLNRFFWAAMVCCVLGIGYGCSSDEPEMSPTPPEEPNTPEEAPPPVASWEEPADMPPATFPSQFEPLSAEVQPLVSVGKRWYQRFHSSDDTFVDKWLTMDSQEEFDGKNAYHISGISSMWGDFYLSEENGATMVNFYAASTSMTDPSKEFDMVWLTLMDLDPDYQGYGGSHVEYITVSKGTIKLMGKTRRAVKLYINRGGEPGIPYEYWVEGIGPIRGYFPIHIVEGPPILNTAKFSVRVGDLLLCYDGDELIYDYREFSPDRYEPTEVFFPEYEGFTEYGYFNQ